MKKGSTQIIIFALILLSLGVVATFVLIKHSYFNSPFMQAEEKLHDGTMAKPQDETSDADETANWKTYESNNFPFTFKYPANTNIVPTANVTTQFTLIYPEDDLSNPMNLTFDYRKENITLNEYVKKQIDISKSNGEEILTNLSEEDVNGLAGLTFTSKDNQVSGITAKHIFLKFPKGDNILGISHVGAHRDVANQILSTFKFTE